MIQRTLLYPFFQNRGRALNIEPDIESTSQISDLISLVELNKRRPAENREKAHLKEILVQFNHSI